MTLVSLFVAQKGCGYHLDLLMVGVMLAVCSIMGLPWFVAATVLSISHVNSLKLESESSAPGEQPRFLGIREQRLTGLVIFLLMGCSVFMTGLLQVVFAACLAMLPPCGGNMLVTRSKKCHWLMFLLCVFASIVYSDAGVVWCFPLYGSVFT